MLKIYHPEIYQGSKKRQSSKGYFEGWYFKTVSPQGIALAIIVGVALNKETSHAFIQTIDGTDGETTFSSFDISEFSTSQEPFSVSIGKNFFSKDTIIIGDRTEIQGKLTFTNMIQLPIKFTRPGIMGWFRYVPRMECYHGVISLRHTVQGSLSLPHKELFFDKSNGYIEKDWGTSFPESYVWMQSNSFSTQNWSFMLSIAKIPWMRKYFRGFLGFLNINQRIIVFSTYTHASLEILHVTEKKITLCIQGKGHGFKNSLAHGEMVKIEANRESESSLAAPTAGHMDRRIGESIHAQISPQYSKEGKLIFADTSIYSGLEMVGDMKQLQSFSKKR